MPETPEELHARAAEALRMPPVEEWETFPFDGEMRPRELQPPEGFAKFHKAETDKWAEVIRKADIKPE